METPARKQPSHKEWRRVAKRERRRRLRRLAGAQRDADAATLAATLSTDAAYSNWIQEQQREQQEKDKRDKEEHELQERLWLEEEAKAQREWRILQERKLKARQQQQEQEAKIREEFEAKQEIIRKKKEEEKRRQEEDLKRHELLLKEIDDYIDNGIKTPEALREVIDSQPGKELCPFFTKTGACRYGNTCSRNHRRLCLSKVILVPSFYSHFAMEKNSAEYDTDIGLEFESSETRQHFSDFYKDVLPELETYGRIRTLKACYNTEIHLRGNLYVEYQTEREAARALRSLKGRWYAGRQLNCEFCNLKSWRSAVCGTSKCPKGRACNFLHTFRNPRDDYDIKSPPRWARQAGNQDATGSRRSEHSSRSKSNWEEVAGSEISERKHWRWSESPEPDPESRSRRSEKRHHRSSERNQSQKPVRDAKYNRSDRAKSPEGRRKQSSERSRGDDVKNGRDTSRSRSSKSRRSGDCDSDYHESKRTHRSYSNGRREKDSHSKSEKYHEKRGRRRNSDHEDEKHKSHKYNELEEDRVRISSRSSLKLKHRRSPKRSSDSKSRWDKKEYESSSSESLTASDRSSGSDSEDGVEEKRPHRVRVSIAGEVKDNWATTDSGSEDNDRCPT